MKIKFLYFLPAILLALFISSCDSIQQASYEDTGVGGIVMDSATRLPVTNAMVRLLPDGVISYTDSVGKFYIGKIHVPTSAGNYWLSVTHPGYDTAKQFVILYAGDTTKFINIVLLQSSSEVFIKHDVVVSEYFDWRSYSSLNLYDLVAVQDTNYLFRDMNFRDSSHTRNNFRMTTGWDYPTGYGWMTMMTDAIGNYSQAEFDNISSLYGGRPLNPDIDFNRDKTSSFTVPSSPGTVYGFYLLGRYIYGGGPRIYGLIRIGYTYYDSGQDLNVVVVDIKINRNGNNYFLQYKSN